MYSNSRPELEWRLLGFGTDARYSSALPHPIWIRTWLRSCPLGRRANEAVPRIARAAPSRPHSYQAKFRRGRSLGTGDHGSGLMAAAHIPARFETIRWLGRHGL